MDNAPTLRSAARRALLAVAETGSFAAAARALGLSQPAVSQQIRDLERQSDAALFERLRGRLRPTPFCRELLDIAEDIAELELRAAQLLQRRRAVSGGMLRIALGNTMPGMALIAAFQRDFPQVQISVMLSDYAGTVEAVHARRADIGVLPDLPDDARFERETLLEQDVVAILHPDDPLARTPRLDCRRLMRAPLIFRSRGSSTQRIVDAAFFRDGLVPRPRLVLDTRDGVCEAVVNGLGVGFMWRHGTARTDLLRRIPVEGFAAPRPEAVFRLKDSTGALLDAFFSTARALRLHWDSARTPG